MYVDLAWHTVLHEETLVYHVGLCWFDERHNARGHTNQPFKHACLWH